MKLLFAFFYHEGKTSLKKFILAIFNQLSIKIITKIFNEISNIFDKLAANIVRFTSKLLYSYIIGRDKRIIKVLVE